MFISIKFSSIIVQDVSQLLVRSCYILLLTQIVIRYLQITSSDPWLGIGTTNIWLR